MEEIIEVAILKFNLSSLEDYYMDDNNRLRARGFIYDEDTGVFLNEYGLLEIEEPRIEGNKEKVREIFNFKAERPILELASELYIPVEPNVFEEAVA